MENFAPMDTERRPKWRFKNMKEVHRVSNAILRYIVVNERSKRWTKVVEAYKRLLWVIDRKHFPSDYEPPASYTVLLYELNFHLGLALQRLGMHKKSIEHYTQAIQVVSIPKGGCLAGCVANSCMMTPIYARRAFAYTQTGDHASALKDSESAVVLDNQNPDVYCIRALVRNCKNEDRLALKDLDYALSFSPNHVSCLVVRGAITRPWSPKYPGDIPRQNKYLRKAERLNPDSQSYFNVDSFNHPCVQDFYDRMLFTLLVPHTMTEINLTPDKPSKKQMDSSPDQSRSESSRSGNSQMGSPTRMGSPTEKVDPFRCGTPSVHDNRHATRRRLDYGEAVRKHNSRPKTATEYMAVLEKERRKRIEASTRAQSASITGRKISSDNRSVRFNATTSLSSVERCQSAHKSVGQSSSTNTSGRTTKTRATKAFVFETPNNYSIPVFQPMNIADAPRMYYRPWRGDKLPLGEVIHPQPSPAFY